MRKACFSLLFLLLIFPGRLFAALPDSLPVTDISRDTVDQPPKGWTQNLPGNQRVFTTYMVAYAETGPYIRAVSNSAGSWLERDMSGVDVRNCPVLEWEWMVNVFPEVEWERNREDDDFAIRLELLYDYPGGRWNILKYIRKGLIASLFRGNPPVLTISYVWSVGVPAGKEYRSPESDRIAVVPLESGTSLVRRWLHERRNIRDDLERLAPEEKKLVLKKIRIRCDTEDSRTRAESGIRDIRLIAEEQADE